ncbi:MAG: hypothetical protein IKB30_02995 [Clostridia bacterium]|nr:hypothetical protein [Clostridia bacterium]
MNSAKSYKLIVLFTAFVLAIVAAFCSMGVTTARAATEADPYDYFSVTVKDTGDAVDSVLAFNNDNLVATVKDGDVLSIDRKLVINDFAMEIVAPDFTKFEKITFKFAASSYYVNGNKNTDGGFDTEIVNAYDMTSAMDKVSVSVDDGYLTINNNVYTNAYNRVDVVDLVAATISVEFDLKSGVDNAEFAIKSIDQKASDASGNYKQTFEIDETTEELTKKAYPRIALGNDVFTRTPSGEVKLVMLQGKEKSLNFTVYSVLGNVSASSVYMAKDGNNTNTSILLPTVEKPKKVTYKENGNDSFTIKCTDIDAVIETYGVEVVAYDNNEGTHVDENAPVYVNDIDAVEAFKAALAKKVKDEDGKSIYLGAKLELPSLADLVFDDVKPYADLTSTVYYFNRSESTTSSNMSFTVSKDGDYIFYVSFSDGKNAMESKEFFEEDENDSNVKNYGVYGDYVFNFHVIDDAEILIETSSVEGLGYKNIKYTASKFKIDAEGCTTTYTLYYSADKNADVNDEADWVKVPAASNVTNTTYNENGLTYDAVKAIAYDGELTFVPTKLGSYKIVCNATSTYTTRTATETSVVRITDSATVVKLPNYWLRDNAWSVVFLSVGTLCLIGIIVLLCIKPKEETESD